MPSKIIKSSFSNLAFISLASLLVLGACSPKPATTNETAPAAEATPPAAAEAATNATATTNETAAAPAAPAAAAVSAEDTAKLASLPAPYKDADLANGKRQFAVCKTCHTTENNGPNRVGPNLHGIIGRTAGTHASFAYSDGLKAAGFKWDYAKLEEYLTNPKAVIKDSRMAFAGIPAANNRRDVIAYVAVESQK